MSEKKSPLNHNFSQPESDTLSVDQLEPRMMLSTVSIGARGATGEENMQVLVNDDVFLDVVVPSSNSTFTFEVDETINESDLRIQFTNDLYQPEQGIDRNIFLQGLTIDGQSIGIGGANTFSTATWRAADGITPGVARGTTLHANGYIEFLAQRSSFEFDGFRWDANTVFTEDQLYVDDINNEIVLSGINGPLSFSREFGVVGGDVHELVFEGYRNVISGSFDGNGPWATVGVNFYNQFGRQLGQETIEVNGSNTDPADQFRTKDFVAPDNATSAYVWVWIDGFDSGTNIPIRVGDLQLNRIELNDTTPPTATLNPFNVTEAPGSDEINFAIDFEDDTRLGQFGGNSADAIVITGPNGFQTIAQGVAGGPGTTDTFQKTIFAVSTQDGSDWSESNNGTYTVTLAENSLVDQAGNVAAGGVLGQFEVNIPPFVPDTQAPEISLAPRNVQASPGPVEITVLTLDDRDDNAFAGRITVFNDAGFSIEATGIAGGFDSGFNRLFEIFPVTSPSGNSEWTAADSGIYFVKLEDGVLSDESGNFTPGQIIGSFVIDIDLAVG